MIVDVHSHLRKSPDYRLIEKLISSKALDQAWILECLDHRTASREEILKLKKEFGPFFKIFAYLDFYSEPDGITRLKDMGFEGLKSIYPGKPYNHPDWFPFYEKAEKEKMPILFHTGNAANPPRPVNRDYWTRYSPDADFMRPIYMDIIAKLFPDLILIMAHFGGELWRNEAFDMVYNHANVYADLSGINALALEGLNECMNRCVYYDRSLLVSRKLLFAVDTLYGDEEGVGRIHAVRVFWESFLESYGWDKPWGKDKDRIMGETARGILGDV